MCIRDRGFPKATIEEKDGKFLNVEERKVMSQEKNQGTGFIEKLKNSIFGSGKNEIKTKNKTHSALNISGNKEIKTKRHSVRDIKGKEEKREKSPENDYKVDFDRPFTNEVGQWKPVAKSLSNADLIKQLKKKNNKMMRQDTLEMIKQPNDILSLIHI